MITFALLVDGKSSALNCLIAVPTVPEPPGTTRIPAAASAFEALGPHLPVRRILTPFLAIIPAVRMPALPRPAFVFFKASKVSPAVSTRMI